MEHNHVAVLALVGGLAVLGTQATFAQGVLDDTHFRCYIVSKQEPDPPVTLTLTDQFFEDETVTTNSEPLQFCAPTSKNGEGIPDPDEHLTMYVAPRPLVPHLVVSTQDQFGPRTLRLVGARTVMVPTQKLVGGLGFPDALNHYRCYEADGDRVQQDVSLDDQFGLDLVRVERPKLFCNPVEKVHDGATFPILEPESHLTCYEIHAPQRTEAISFDMRNQIEVDNFTVTAFELLCVPARKLGFVPEGQPQAPAEAQQQAAPQIDREVQP